jgi:hypothetical protein
MVPGVPGEKYRALVLVQDLEVAQQKVTAIDTTTPILVAIRPRLLSSRYSAVE